MDPDGDAIAWSLDQAPQGMVVDSQTGVIAWTPTADEIGAQNAVLRVVDARGASATQPFSVQVRGTTAPPLILSSPPTAAQQDSGYSYQVVASDPNGLPLTFSVTSDPAIPDLSIDPTGGLLTWGTPDASGSPYNITITASDGVLSVSQPYTLTVSTGTINQPPSITSTPGEIADIGAAYSYQVVATDPENDLGPTPYSLRSGPAGMTMDQASGLLNWPTPVAGTFSVTVEVTDAGGSLATQTYPITVANQRPQIVHDAPLTDVAGALYVYDVTVDGGTAPIAFSLDSASLGRGMHVDGNGRVTWTPGSAGSVPVTVSVTDAAGATDSYAFTLDVAADTTAPDVAVQVSQSPAPIGSPLTVTVLATDDVGVESGSLGLSATDPNGDPATVTPVSGQPGTWTITPTVVGTYTFTATANDINGNIGTGKLTLTTYDSSVTSAPDASITSPSPDINGDDPVITAPTDIQGTVTGNGPIESYTLQAFPQDGGDPVNIPATASYTPGVTTTISGVLGTFDPTILPNDTYTIVLTATNSGGLAAQTSVEVAVTGQFKLGNFSLNFTDLSLPLGGIPITVTRGYDTLNANVDGDFGYGWTFGYAQAKLQTTNLVPPGEQAGFGAYPGFVIGTHVWITLPGGQREEFTFNPTAYGDDSNPFQWLAGPQQYLPAFTSVTPGVTDTLSVDQDIYLQTPDGSDAGIGSQLVDGGSFDAYNPANPEFGGRYTLTTKDGIQYDIDAATGRIDDVRNRAGDSISYSDTAIVSKAPDGTPLGQITIDRDPAHDNRIADIIDPAGNKVVYTYDPTTGDLTGVSHEDSAGSTASSVTLQYNAPQAHYLTGILDGNGVTLLTVNYDPTTGRVTGITDANGNASPLAAPTSVAGGTAETATDAAGFNTILVYDNSGNVVRSIKQEDAAHSGGTATYSVTISEYDGDNNLTAQSLPFETDFADIYTAEAPDYPAYSGGDPNALDPAVVPADWSQVNTYDSLGNLRIAVDAVGRTTTNVYGGPHGELSSTTDGAGDTTLYGYDGSTGNLSSTTDPAGNVTNYSYDTANELSEVDSPPTTKGGQRQYIRYGHTNGYVTQTETGYIDASGNHVAQKTTTNTVDGNGNVTATSSIWTNPSDPSDEETVENDTSYDAAGRAAGTTSGKVTRVSDGAVFFPGTSTTAHYNAAGKVHFTTDSVTGTTTYKYDVAGNLVETDNPDGTETRTAYDALNRAYLTTDRFNPTDGSTVRGDQTIYDGLGRTIETDRLDAVQINITDNGDGTYTATVASPGTVLSRSTTSYNPDGTIDHTVDANGLETDYTYFPDGQQQTVTQKGVPVWDPNMGTTTLQDLTTSYTYDKAGRQQMVTDPLGHVTGYAYDADGRVTRTTFNDGSFIEDTYDGLGDKTSESRQAAAGTPEADLVLTVWKYDQFGQLVEVDQPTVPDPADGNALATPVTTYGYDAYGDQVSQTDADHGPTTFSYDALGRQVGEKLPDVSGQPTASDGTVYNALGQVDHTTDFDGNTAIYTYFNIAPHAGMVQQIDYTGSDKAEQLVTYGYDDLNQKQTITDASGTTTYRYDADNNVVEEDTPEGVIHYVYNDRDQHVSTWTANDTATTEADATTRTDYGYDELGRLVSATVLRLNGADVDLATAYAYDAAGDKAHEALPNGVTTDYSYDDLNRLTDVTEKSGSTTLFSQSYIVNADGTRASSHEEQLQSDNSTVVTTDTTWTYDADGRLTGEAVTSTAVGESYADVFAYDLVGNRVEKSHTGPGGGAIETITYTYDARNELTDQNSSLTGTTTFTYDANGSQTGSSNATTGQNITYTYDVRNKMVGYGDGTTIAAYAYDDAGNRVQETVNGTTTYYLTDHANPTGYAQPVEEKSSPTALPTTTYLIGDHILGQADNSSVVSYLLIDGHGSTQQIASASGSVTRAFRYDAFGGATDFTLGSAGTAVLFGGDALYDSASGLYLHGDGTRGRIGSRFIERDMSSDESDLDPITMNEYIYCGSNTIDAWDPTGLYEEDFHYYTILYLMLARGWDPGTAEQTAFWSQFVDDDPVTNPLNLGTRAKAAPTERARKDAAGLLEIYHFPGSSPTVKTVQNDPATRADVAYWFSQYPASGTPTQHDVVSAGRFLHTYADSWAHAGYSAFTGGHGSAGHAPDRPYNNVPKALDAATNIFNLIPLHSGKGSYHPLPLQTVLADLTSAFAPKRSDLGVREDDMAMLIMTRFPGMNQLSFAYGAVTPPNAEQIFESQFNLNSPGIGGKIVNGAVEVGAFVYDLF